MDLQRYKSARAEMIALQNKLTSDTSDIGDWKIIKCQEYMLYGMESPYDISDLHEKRQAVRNRINELQAELDNM